MKRITRENSLPQPPHWRIQTTMEEKPISVIETPEFLTVTRRIMDDEERAVLIDYLAYNPGAGDLIRGTGGVRKLRWGLAGRGKRGGARVVYFYHSPKIPLFALTAFAKGQQTDLTQAERNGLRTLTARLLDTYLKNL